MNSDRSRESLAGAAFSQIGGFLSSLGPLRVALVFITLLTIILAPGVDEPTAYEGFAFFRTVILPTIAPLCLSGLLFDALMSKVVMGDAPDEAGRRRLRLIIRTELLVAAVLLLNWVPFFMTIGQ